MVRSTPPDPNMPTPFPSVEAALSNGHAVVLFDGVCNLCNGAVNFIIDRDPEGHVQFAPLQSELAQTALEARGHSASDLDTMVLLTEEAVYVRSDAALRIARRLSGAWPLLSLFVWVPRPLRDAVYDWVASHRYDWFGTRASCRLPTPDLRHRFLAYDPPD
jgi:predicted DCC family thiol-disulfide oxidoreductase YuxK